MTVLVGEIARFLDHALSTPSIPDHPNALNGLQCEHDGPVHKIAAAVDFSRRVLEETIRREANLLLVHHGMFWGGLRALTGHSFKRLRLVVSNDVAVYASHLPLDAHPSLGNNALLARHLGLTPSLPFARFQGVAVGTAGESNIETSELLSRVDHFSREHAGIARASVIEPERRTRRWAICTGAGASQETLREASELGIDTLIVGEGPHHTAVEAPEQALVIIYAGHYATETLGVRALTSYAAAHFGLPWEFIPSPTGL
jgi:dinuclear metal center YbgI/SA1388 family protein